MLHYVLIVGAFYGAVRLLWDVGRAVVLAVVWIVLETR